MPSSSAFYSTVLFPLTLWQSFVRHKPKKPENPLFHMPTNIPLSLASFLLDILFPLLPSSPGTYLREGDSEGPHDHQDAMNDMEADPPYILWFQCRRCSHLFFNEKRKILSHVREHHGYDFEETTPTIKGTPLKIKEQHFRSEEALQDDVINNNNNNYIPKHSISPQKRMPKLLHKDEMKKEGSTRAAIPIPQNVPSSANFKSNAISNNNNNHSSVKRVVPSIEELKRQLVNSDLDISEIKMSSFKEEEDYDEQDNPEQHEMPEEYEEEYAEEIYEGQVYDEEGAEEMSEEGASTSNQSFYDDGIGEHFLFKSEGDSESYEDEGIMTPNFGMVDELYDQLSNRLGAASSSGSSDPMSAVRRRSFHNPCKLCNKVFPSMSMLKKHAKSHLNEEGGSMHICKFCTNLLPSAAALSKHLLIHTDDNPNVCTLCGKSFTSWATLRTHMKIHSGERPFKCEFCESRFQTKSTLDSHLRIHSGSRPHVCTICGKSFRTSSPLYRHIRSVHKGLTMNVPTVKMEVSANS